MYAGTPGVHSSHDPARQGSGREAEQRHGGRVGHVHRREQGPGGASHEGAGPDPSARWARMIRLLTEPTLPSDLVGAP